MPITSVGDLANSWDSNKVWRQHWHKTASPTINQSGFWMDLSMAAGTPKYNPYVGNALEFTPLVGGSNNGINAGLGGDSYIVRYNIAGGGTANGPWPGNAMLLDYVGFYPLVDMDATDVQVFDNTAYSSRYSSGLRVMCVTTIPQTAASATEVRLRYIGSNDVETFVKFWIGSTVSAGCINSYSSASVGNPATHAPFIPLGMGTLDVKQLVSVEVTGSSGGFCAFVLVRPILEAVAYDTITSSELEFPRNKVPPRVVSGAYLNHIVCPMVNGSTSGVTRGHVVFARE
jgi:hypothetical protein